MRLTEMQKIAHDLGRPRGELAPLAGAGGSFNLQVPFTSSGTIAGPLETSTRTAVTLNLLNNGSTGNIDVSPTLLEQWAITALHVPVAFKLELAEAVEAASTLRLLRGGEVVFQARSLGVLEGLPADPKVLSESYNADFNNPLWLKRGMSLKLELSVTFTKNAVKNVVVALGAEVESASRAIVAAGGVVAYDSHTLSGHRVL